MFEASKSEMVHLHLVKEGKRTERTEGNTNYWDLKRGGLYKDSVKLQSFAAKPGAVKKEVTEYLHYGWDSPKKNHTET